MMHRYQKCVCEGGGFSRSGIESERGNMLSGRRTKVNSQNSSIVKGMMKDGVMENGQ